MTDCKAILNKVFEYLDKELTEIDQKEFERHIELCRGCYNRFDFEQALRARIRAIAGKDQAPPQLRKRVEDMLAKYDK